MEKTKIKKLPVDSGLEKLMKLIEILNGESGCPWDKKQTPGSISIYLAEEVHELVEAIQSGDKNDIREELGDVLFQVLFIARLYENQDAFNLEDVIEAVCHKMIRRHPHVFENKTSKSVDEIRKQWRDIKKNEKPKSANNSILNSVPSGLPAILKAYRISERAAGAGFDWNNMAGVIEKLYEEIDEFKSAFSEKNKKKIKTEFGDILFTLVNVARFAKIHPETSLYDSIHKFEKRFRYMENRLSTDGMNIESVSSEEMELLWKEAKKKV